MKLFVYEHFSSGAFLERDFSLEMLGEGIDMLEALSYDLISLGHEVYHIRDHRFTAEPMHHPALHTYKVNHRSAFNSAWQVLTQDVDATLIIAPETDGALTQWVHDLEQRRLRHLNTDSDTIALCSDKLRLASFFSQHHLHSPQTYSVQAWLKQEKREGQWIVKPRDGAGCERTFIFDTAVCEQHIAALSESDTENTVIQSYIDGESLSLSLFIDDSQAHLISINRQHLNRTDAELTLSHIDTNRTDLLSAHIAQQLADHLHHILPGLHGFIGVDVIKHEDGLSVIEINPRLTSAYPALKPNQKQAYLKLFDQNLYITDDRQ